MTEPGHSLPAPPRVRAVAIVAVAVAFGAALAHLPGALRAIDGDTSELAALAPSDRPLVGAFSTDVDRAFLQEAKRVIPADARYLVVTGDGVTTSSPTTLAAVAPYAGYWLLPRAQVTDAAAADWIVSYGGDLRSLGVPLARTIEVSPGLVLAEVASS